MPVISIALHQIESDMKERLVEGLTKAAADATSIPQSSFIVLVDEYPDDAIGIGGRTLAAVKSAKPQA